MAVSLLPAGGLAATLNVKSYGARGDGRTDDTAAIVKAVSAARQSTDHVLYFPDGRYRYSHHIDLDGVHVEGAGPTRTFFEALNNTDSAWVLIGNAPGLRNVSIRPVSLPTQRASTPESAGVHVSNATSFLVDRVQITGTASAGIIVRGSGGIASAYARISYCSVQKTLADGIHMTLGSHHIEVDSNQVSGVGDDMIAVVSYRSQPAMTHHVRITNNVLTGNTWGRGISVVGGTDVTIAENTISRSSAAGIYLASEAGYDTVGAWRVSVLSNVLEDCVVNASSGHGAIMIFGREPSSSGDNRSGDLIAADNIIRGAGRDGIWCGKYTVSTLLLRNRIENVTGNGIRVGENAAQVTLVGNVVDGAGSSGLAVWNSCNALSVHDDPALGGANKFSHCGQYGIWVDATGGSGTLDLIGSRISAVNQRGAGGMSAIKISGSASGYVVTLLNNQVDYDTQTKVDTLWRSDIPVALSQGDSMLEDGFVPIYID